MRTPAVRLSIGIDTRPGVWRRQFRSIAAAGKMDNIGHSHRQQRPGGIDHAHTVKSLFVRCRRDRTIYKYQ